MRLTHWSATPCAWAGCGVPRLRARRRGHHSAGGAPCGLAAFGLAASSSAGSRLAVTASWPAGLTRMARPLSDARFARHPTARPGAVPCGSRRARQATSCPQDAHCASKSTARLCAVPCSEGRARSAPACLQGTARRSRCGVPRGARRRAAGVAFRKLRRAERNTGRKARPAEPRELTPKADGPQGSSSTQCRPPRVARSRGAPQRGRRARDASLSTGRVIAHRTHVRKSVPPL